jgi:hypothetical protein
MRSAGLLAIGGLVLCGCQAGALHTTKIAPSALTRLGSQRFQGAGPVRRLVSEIWSIGFFRQNSVVREEFSNNDYKIFESEKSLSWAPKEGLACYSRIVGKRDTIFLRADTLAHVRVGIEGVIEQPHEHAKTLSVIVHELCHDLWMNVLDDTERTLFAMEGEEFIDDYLQAKTPEDQRLFLQQAGQNNLSPGSMRTFSDLDTLIRLYPSQSRCGAELFAWLGEHAFSGRTAIPARFRKYYSGLFANDAIGPARAPR